MIVAARHLLFALPFILALTACGGDDPPGPVPVASVTLAPSTLALHPGESAQLTATLCDRTGADLVGHPVTWSTDNASVATVSTGGLVTAVAVAGPARITATSEGISVTATVSETNIPIASISLAPATLTLESGDTARLTATPRSATGESLTGHTITWTSAKARVATISASGLLTGLAPGGPESIITTSEGVQATAQVTVTPVAVRTVTLAPNSATKVAGTHARSRRSSATREERR